MSHLYWQRGKAGDILLNITGDGVTFGRACAIPGEVLPACVNQHVSIIRPDETQMLSGWLLCYLTHPEVKPYIESFNSGGSRRAITQGHIQSFIVPLPPTNEQRAIVQLLGALDDKIELNRQMNRTLEEMARALFRSWFVDFDPVQAKRDGRKPFGMHASTAGLFPEHFEESALGPMPRGWRVSTIGEEVHVVGGSTPSTEEPRFWAGGTLHWVTPRDLSKLSDPAVLDTERMITAEGLAQISSGLLPVGTVLLSSRAPIGYTAVAAVPVAVNQGFIAMKCERQLGSQFVLRWTEESLDEITVCANVR